MDRRRLLLLFGFVFLLFSIIVGCGGSEEGTAGRHFDLGNELAWQGRYDEAIEEYTRAIELAPNVADAYINRGLAYEELGEYEQAIADYTKAIELVPDLAIAYSNRGVVYDLLDDYKQAIADHTKAIELDPNDAWNYYNRGCSYKQVGKKAEAIADLEKAITLMSDPLFILEIQGLIEELTE